MASKTRRRRSRRRVGGSLRKLDQVLTPKASQRTAKAKASAAAATAGDFWGSGPLVHLADKEVEAALENPALAAGLAQLQEARRRRAAAEQSGKHKSRSKSR